MSETKHESMTRIYLAVFGALAVLTVLTVGASYLHLTRSLAIAVAMIIVAVKVSLIAAFFMHLKLEGKLIHRIFYTALFLVCLLLFLVLPDIAFR